MSHTLTEQKVLKKLGIPDFRHMTKDKVVKFASMLPKMDPRVAKKAIDQFPEFKEMAMELTNALKEIVDKAFKSSEESQRYFYTTCNNVIEKMHEELLDDDIDEHEREIIRDNILEVLKLMSQKDSEHKEFVRSIAAIVTTCVAVITASAAALLGGALLLTTSDSDDDEDDTIEGEFHDSI